MNVVSYESKLAISIFMMFIMIFYVNKIHNQIYKFISKIIMLVNAFYFVSVITSIINAEEILPKIAMSDDVVLMNKYLKDGANVNIIDYDGNSLLMNSISRKKYNVKIFDRHWH